MADQQEHVTGEQPAGPYAPPAAPPTGFSPPGSGPGYGYGGSGYGAPAPGYGQTPAWVNQTQPITDPGAPVRDPFGPPAQFSGPAAPDRPDQYAPTAGGPGDPGHPGTPSSFAPRREPRRSGPGWGGVIAMGAGAAVLSSLLTAGAFTAFDDSTTSPTTTSSSSSQAAAPLVTSSGSLPDWGAVAAAVEPSVVSVQVEAGQSSGLGSGVIMDTAGHILTNNHVVGAATGNGQITVVLSDGRAYPAAIVGTDPSTDLAVIKLSSSVSGLKPATFGDSSVAKAGDPVMAVGNPLGLSDTVTTGIVSAVNRPVSTSESGGQNGQQTSADRVVTNAIQTDAAINPGNSGGALVDAGGRVLGVTSSIASLSSGSSGQSGSIGLGFAIPINEAKRVADALVKTGKFQHAYMGVGLQPQDGSVTVDGAQREAAIVRTVSAGTPAAKAGLKAGDAIIAINNQRVDSGDSVIGTVRSLTPGTKVTLTIVRGGTKQDVAVTLAAAPAS
jgi:putative serine protease PepD